MVLSLYQRNPLSNTCLVRDSTLIVFARSTLDCFRTRGFCELEDFVISNFVLEQEENNEYLNLKRSVAFAFKFLRKKILQQAEILCKVQEML